jgi:hypothetical protein
MAFDGEFLITGGDDRSVRVHRNTITPGAGPQSLGACVHTMRGHSERVIGVARLEGTRQAVSAAPDGELKFVSTNIKLTSWGFTVRVMPG